jgi:plasmid stabilization system protein ParE
VKVVYLKEAQPGLTWWNRYYRVTFPAGKSSAKQHFRKTKEYLKQNPRIGKPIGIDNLRQLIIPNTPFVIIYRIADDTIEIVQIRDGRSEPEPGFHEEQVILTK